MMLLLSVIAIFLLFSLSIFVHELGHFLVARLLGMTADVFSIGMGKAVWSRKWGNTIYKIGALPIGGYVALPQMDPNSFLEGGNGADAPPPERILPPVAPWKRILVSLAGAGGNILFAFLLSAVVWMVGKPSSPSERNGIIGYVKTDSIVALAGIQPGDEIIAVNGEPVSNWTDINTAGALHKEVILTVRQTSGVLQTVTLATEKSDSGLRYIPDMLGMGICNVGRVIPGSPAEAAGILSGDQILTFDGQKVYSNPHLTTLVDHARDREVRMTVLRGGKHVELTIIPVFDAEENRAMIGIYFSSFNQLDFDEYVHPTPWAQIKTHVNSIAIVLKAFSNRSTAAAAADGLGGPVLIFSVFWLMFKASFILGVWFTAFLNVNLAIINLLPIPVLDGGHILFALWEIIFRRPVPVKVVNVLVNFFAILLVAGMIFLIYRDIQRQIVRPLQAKMKTTTQTTNRVPAVFLNETETPAAPEEMPDAAD